MTGFLEHDPKNELYKLYESANKIGFDFKTPKAEDGILYTLEPTSITHEKIDTKGFDEEDLEFIKKQIEEDNFDNLVINNTKSGTLIKKHKSNKLFNILKEYVLNEQKNKDEKQLSFTLSYYVNDLYNTLYKKIPESNDNPGPKNPIMHLYIACKYYNYKNEFLKKKNNKVKAIYSNISFHIKNMVITTLFDFYFDHIKNLNDTGKKFFEEIQENENQEHGL